MIKHATRATPNVPNHHDIHVALRHIWPDHFLHTKFPIPPTGIQAATFVPPPYPRFARCPLSSRLQLLCQRKAYVPPHSAEPHLTIPPLQCRLSQYPSPPPHHIPTWEPPLKHRIHPSATPHCQRLPAPFITDQRQQYRPIHPTPPNLDLFSQPQHTTLPLDNFLTVCGVKLVSSGIEI